MRLAVCVSSRIQLDTALPWLDGLGRRGFGPFLVAPPEVLEAASVLDTAFDSTLPVSDGGFRAAAARRLGSLISTLTTPPAFSPYYSRSVGRSRGGRVRGSVARLLTASDPSAATSNRLAGAVSARVHPGFPPADAVLVVSVCSFPHLVAAARVPRLTLMESWDHPRSRPAAYPTEVVAGWNRELTEEWIRFQGAAAGVVGFPTKLRYAIEDPVGRLDEAGAGVRLEHGRLLYAATASGNTPRGWLFGEELELIGALAEATGRLRLKLLVKPKPNGRPGEFDDLLRRHPHLSIGRYGAARGPADYALDAEYNQYRLEEMASVDAVVNLGSTYALDAAAAEVPVIQLDVRQRTDLPDLADAQKAWHLSNHLLRYEETTVVQPGSGLPPALEGALETGLGSGSAYARRLRDWLVPSGSFDDAVQRVAEALLERTTRRDATGSFR